MQKKSLLIIMFFCVIFIPKQAKASKELQSITCTYKINHYVITYSVNSTGSGGAILNDTVTKEDVNNRTNYVFSAPKNPVVSDNFIKDSKLVCPNTLYVKYQAGASTNVGVQVSFVKFSDSKAEVSLSSQTDNQKPFISSENTSGKACQYQGVLTQGNGSVPITITREGNDLKYELTNGYKIQNNELAVSDFPADKNGTCPTIYIKCGSSGNDKFCHLYKNPTTVDESQGNTGQTGQEPPKPTEPDKNNNNSNNSTNNANNNNKKPVDLRVCNNKNVKIVLKFIGYFLLIAKILVPILLIVFGAIDYSKAMVSNEVDIQKATKNLIFRILAGMVIFILPTLINFVFSNIVKESTGFNQCRACIFNRKC